MSKEKFTQGEWVISHDNDHAGEYVNVGMAQLYSNYHDKEQAAQNVHDAHLIAAAPDMYRMLEVISDRMHKTDQGSIEDILTIEKLLAKARGE